LRDQKKKISFPVILRGRLQRRQAAKSLRQAKTSATICEKNPPRRTRNTAGQASLACLPQAGGLAILQDMPQKFFQILEP
jgi:hypothetical protein